ncbi:MAG: L-seryl-tRNA(Ser) seleniumtransferase [Acidobacteriota bacterium]|nr:L-seryl-tRNA(Ser) seleniumtransferase [Acidobacteriota bacterium]
MAAISNDNLLRAVPSIDALLRTKTALDLRGTVGSRHLTRLARTITDQLRSDLVANASPDGAVNGEHSREALLAEAATRLERACQREALRGIRRVINASGVILHTNLGRAPLSEAARQAVADEAAGYCTLEFDLESGSRGRRGARVEELLIELTGAEAALMVNNCSAAALLVLSVLAQGGETIVSRGELIEIGGDFRIPDVMTSSGTALVEVGTTNRTHASDYIRAITPNSRLVMHVHPSNYRVVGFTATPEISELAELAYQAGLLLYVDAGSGALQDLSQFGLAGEPVIAKLIGDGADVVTFSGDKLLGGAQGGLIVGRAAIVDKLRRHPLYRALRADKLGLAATEATLEAHRRNAIDEIPTLRMLALTREQIEQRARSFIQTIREHITTDSLSFEIVPGQSAIGGGSAPTTHPATSLIGVTHKSLTPAVIEKALREGRPPVISRIAEGRVLLDLRTVEPSEEADLLSALLALPA